MDFAEIPEPGAGHPRLGPAHGHTHRPGRILRRACERAGVVNIAIEGMMLMAAMVGDLVMLYTGSVWVGVVAGVSAAGSWR